MDDPDDLPVQRQHLIEQGFGLRMPALPQPLPVAVRRDQLALHVLHGEVGRPSGGLPPSYTVAIAGWSISASACRSASNRVTTCAVFPAGATDYYVFTLFDTGATRVYIDNSTAATLGLGNGAVTNIRINGLGAIDPVTLEAPMYAGQAQAEVAGVPVSLPASAPDITLIGGPVTNEETAESDAGRPCVESDSGRGNCGLGWRRWRSSARKPIRVLYPSSST